MRTRKPLTTEQKHSAYLAVKRYQKKWPLRIAEQKKKGHKKRLAYLGGRRADLKLWAKVNLPLIRHRAKRQGRKFTITSADIIVPSHCPVLGIKLQSGMGQFKNGKIDNSPSVDRWNNKKGYVSGNVFVISHRANQLKRDATVQEIERLLVYMKRGIK